jgi:hypothetical protein
MQMTMIRFESGDAAHTNFIYPTKDSTSKKATIPSPDGKRCAGKKPPRTPTRPPHHPLVQGVPLAMLVATTPMLRTV